jgi:hypothetical protein
MHRRIASVFTVWVLASGSGCSGGQENEPWVVNADIAGLPKWQESRPSAGQFLWDVLALDDGGCLAVGPDNTLLSLH